MLCPSCPASTLALSPTWTGFRSTCWPATVEQGCGSRRRWRPDLRDLMPHSRPQQRLELRAAAAAAAAATNMKIRLLAGSGDDLFSSPTVNPLLLLSSHQLQSTHTHTHAPNCCLTSKFTHTTTSFTCAHSLLLLLLLYHRHLYLLFFGALSSSFSSFSLLEFTQTHTEIQDTSRGAHRRSEIESINQCSP